MTATVTAKITTTRDGFVRRDGHTIGLVEKIDWPAPKNGHVATVKVWEARRAHEIFTVNPHGLRTFNTRREAVEYLSEQPALI